MAARDFARLAELSNRQLQRMGDTHSYITGDPIDEETVTMASEILKRRGGQPGLVPDAISADALPHR